MKLKSFLTWHILYFSQDVSHSGSMHHIIAGIEGPYHIFKAVKFHSIFGLKYNFFKLFYKYNSDLISIFPSCLRKHA